MAAILDDDAKLAFQQEVSKFEELVNGLMSNITNANSKLDDKVGTKFNNNYADGKKIVNKLKKVLDIVSDRKDNLNALIEDLKNYGEQASLIGE